jgi:CubicO group peptidase (beta-lactamase class C family)
MLGGSGIWSVRLRPVAVGIVNGGCDERFGMVRQAMASTLESGADVGCSVAVVHDGELVVDLWGGYIDEARSVVWDRDTLTCVFSTTKAMTALCMLILADRGDVDLHAPVARYWPEFAAGGKEGVELRHILSHTAGLPTWSEPVTVADLCDWEKVTSLLAAATLWWEPGTALGYHALTHGYLVGEVVRRITGRSIGQFVAEEVAGPLGVDFHIGTPPSVDPRIAPAIHPATTEDPLDPGSLAYRVATNPRLSPQDLAGEAVRRAEIPAGNGYGNARSVAMAQSAVSCGTRDLLSEAGRAAIFEVQAEGTDLVMGVPLRMGIGYGLNSELLTVSPNERACFWAGSGGSLVVNDLDAHMTIAYVMNRMVDDASGPYERGASMVMAAYASLADAS